MRRHFTELRRLPTFLKRLLTFVKSLLILLKCLLFVVNCLVEWKTCRIFAQTMKRALTYSLSCVCALVLLMGCARDGAQMREQLSALEQRNRSDEPMVNDSLAEALADYFDRHGSANERMRAKYILGRTYADMGETTRAVDCYLDAVAKADTTSPGCDYAVLGRVYSQMASLFHKQLLLSNEIHARRQASRCFLCAKDTFHTIYHKGMIAGAYILMNKRDSAEILLRETMRQYREHGYGQDALQTSTMLMHLYAGKPDRLFELKQLIDQYDHESIQFDKYHELPPSKRLFYYYKGNYFEGINLLDSADYYYRKAYNPQMPLTSLTMIYEGLLSISGKLHQADSIVKYSMLYCMATDSSVIRKDQQQTAQLAASYDYHYYKEQYLENENKALWAFIAFAVTLLLLIAFIVGIAYLVKRFRKVQVRLRRIHLEREEELLQLHQEEKEQLQRDYYHKQEQARQEYEHELAKMQSRQEEELTASKRKAVSKKYFTNDVVLRSVLIANNPHQNLTEKAFDDLLTVTYEHFPILQQEFEQNEAMTIQMKKVCILSILDVHVNDIARLLKVSPQRITNLRAELSLILFNQKTARQFESNLLKHFGIKKQ